MVKKGLKSLFKVRKYKTEYFETPAKVICNAAKLAQGKGAGPRFLDAVYSHARSILGP